MNPLETLMNQRAAIIDTLFGLREQWRDIDHGHPFQ
jgi:hypothetical protein